MVPQYFFIKINSIEDKKPNLSASRTYVRTYVRTVSQNSSGGKIFGALSVQRCAEFDSEGKMR